jgi:hypothetical protein
MNHDDVATAKRYLDAMYSEAIVRMAHEILRISKYAPL